MSPAVPWPGVSKHGLQRLRPVWPCSTACCVPEGPVSALWLSSPPGIGGSTLCNCNRPLPQQSSLLGRCFCRRQLTAWPPPETPSCTSNQHPPRANAASDVQGKIHAIKTLSRERPSQEPSQEFWADILHIPSVVRCSVLLMITWSPQCRAFPKDGLRSYVEEPASQSQAQGS